MSILQYEYNGFKKGDMVVSNKAAKGHQKPYEIVCFFCWKTGTVVKLKDNPFEWSVDSLEHYKEDTKDT